MLTAPSVTLRSFVSAGEERLSSYHASAACATGKTSERHLSCREKATIMFQSCIDISSLVWFSYLLLDTSYFSWAFWCAWCWRQQFRRCHKHHDADVGRNTWRGGRRGRTRGGARLHMPWAARSFSFISR